MILDIFTILFFVLGFALIFWMIGERHRDVLHGPYLTKPTGSRGRGPEFAPALEPMQQSIVMPAAPNVVDELSRIVLEIGEAAKSSDGPKRK